MRLHITHTPSLLVSLLHVTVTHYFALQTLCDCQACLPIPKACSSVRKLPRYAIRKQFSFFLTKNLDNFFHALTLETSLLHVRIATNRTLTIAGDYDFLPVSRFGKQAVLYRLLSRGVDLALWHQIRCHGPKPGAKVYRSGSKGMN